MESYSENRNTHVPEFMPKLPAVVSFRPALDQLIKQRKETAALRQQWHQWMAQRLARSHTDLGLVSHSAPGIKTSMGRQQEAGDGSTSSAKPLHSSAAADSAGAAIVDAAAAAAVKPSAAKGPDNGVGGGSSTVVDSLSGLSAVKKPDKVTAMPRLQKSWALPSFSSSDLDALLRRSCRSAATHGAAAQELPRPSPPCHVITAPKCTADRKNRSLATTALMLTTEAEGGEDGLHGSLPLPYHTAITRRPLRRGFPHEAHTFPTLTLGRYHLPQLMEWDEGEAEQRGRRVVPPASSLAQPSPRRDIREWQNEVVKVVPTRPHFSTPLPVMVIHDKVTTLRYPYKVINYDSTCHFYRSWTKTSEKEYVISPEWSSEKNGLRTTEMILTKKDLPAFV